MISVLAAMAASSQGSGHRHSTRIANQPKFVQAQSPTLRASAGDEVSSCTTTTACSARMPSGRPHRLAPAPQGVGRGDHADEREHRPLGQRGAPASGT